MKIAFYCPNKPLTHPHPSGDLVIAQGILSALNQMGHDCREIVQYRSRWFWKSWQGWRGVARAWVAAWGATRTFDPQIWLTYHSYYKSPDLIGPWISRQMRIPYVIFQPMYATRRRKDASTSLGFRLNRCALVRSSHVFVNNLGDLDALCRILPPDRMTYLKPGIYPDAFERHIEHGRLVRQHFGIPEDRFLILTAARWREGVKTESFLHLLRSLILLKESFPEFTLLVVGDGPTEPALREMAQAALPRQVCFAGRAPREEMRRFYSAADVFAFPGIGESLGMVFLEAQSCGTPVVALNTAGVPQVVVDGVTGLLVPKDDGRAMAHAIEQLARDPARRVNLGIAAAHFVRAERNLHHNYLRLSQQLEQLSTSAGR